MKKALFSCIAAILVLAIIGGITIISTGCSQPNHEGFAIYLTKDNIIPDKMPSLNRIKITDTPLIGLDDIVTYSSSTHELTLADNASTRISNLVVPMSGKSFVVCVNRKPIYWGTFWSSFSSAIPPVSCVIVSYPLSHTVQMGNAEGLQISPNILALDYYGADDPRDNTAIIDSLRQAGKVLGEGFAIYLTKGDVPPSQMEALSHVDIVDKPVIGLDDIVSYNSTNHEITLTENGMKNITSLQVPTSGKSFLVCVNKSPIYWGAFWTPISSQSFSGVTIEMPLLSGQKAGTISINLGYPAQSFYRGEDPRNNPVVLDSLRQAGKLITVPDNPLPHSFKGYEIYSWPQDNLWHYTLITGTNRDKTVQEIITGNNTVSGDGLVNIQVIGVDAIKELISRIPQGDFVIWLPGPRADLTQSPVNFGFPPASTVDDIKAYAAQCGLDFAMLTP